jgi:flagellar hook-associated protein 3 FlgL
MSNLLTYVADAGSRLNRLDVRGKIFNDDVLRLYDRLEANEDVDMTEAVVSLKTQDLMYQATLEATAQISGRNLSDYL